jgi:riboflavin synthase
MFTGIVETTAIITKIEEKGTNKTFWLVSSIQNELKVDQSVSHNGVCLTVESVSETGYSVTAIKETIDKTNVGFWNIGTTVNCERCMPAGGRFDGHIVQGHVDQTAICIEIIDQNGSYLLTFQYDESLQNMTVEKGSISVNGVSLTVVNSRENQFSVAIIPYTWQHTNFNALAVGNTVNLEFDIIGKYIQKMMERRK